MTQTTADQTVLYAVQGKDRFSDDWTTFESRFPWEVQRWAEQRAFVLRDEEGAPVVTQRAARDAFVERKDTVLGWVPYTAPRDYAGALRWLERHNRHHPATVGFYRLVEVP